MKLEISNFRSIEQLSIDFPSRSTVIISGPNNGGKSNILSAINYALWGTSIYPNGTICSPRDLLREGSEILKVRFKNDKIDTTRSWNESPNMDVAIEGNNILGSRYEKHEALLKYLGVNEYTQSQLANLLFRTFYISPFSLCILSLPPTERTRYLLSVYGYDKMRELQNTFSGKLKECNSVLNNLSRFIIELPVIKEFNQARYDELKELLKDKHHLHYRNLDKLKQNLESTTFQYKSWNIDFTNLKKLLAEKTIENKVEVSELASEVRQKLLTVTRQLMDLDDVTSCPNCNTYLVYSKNILKKFDSKDIDSDKKELLNEKIKLETELAKSEERTFIIKKFEELDKLEKTVEEKLQAKTKAQQEFDNCNNLCESWKELDALELEQAANEKVKQIYEQSLKQGEEKGKLENETEVLKYICNQLSGMANDLVEHKTIQFCSYLTECLNKVGLSERVEPRFVYSKDEGIFKAIDFIVTESGRKSTFEDIGSLAFQNVLKMVCTVAEKKFFDSGVKNLDMILLDDVLPSTYREFRTYINNAIKLLDNTTRIIAIADTSSLDYDHLFTVERVNGISRIIEG